MRVQTAFNILGAFLIGVLIFLGLWEFSERRKMRNSEWRIGNVHLPDKELGFSGRPFAEDEDSSKIDGLYVYREKIRLDKFGLREVPGRPTQPTKRCVALLGDSNAFGIGVAAEETVAGRLQKALKNTRVINLSYTGYGPHQTLRYLEIGREKEPLAGCQELKAYYFALRDHVPRAAGRAPWGLSAPGYKIENNELLYMGPMHSDLAARMSDRWQKRLKITRPILAFLMGYNRPTLADEELYRRIMAKIHLILNQRYGAQLQVVFVDQGKGRDQLLQRLEQPLLPVRYVENLAAAAGKGGFILSYFYLFDGVHLNSQGHALVAQELLKTDLALWAR